MRSPPGLLPLGVGASPEAVHGPFLPQIPERARESLAADALAHLRQFPDRESRRQVSDGILDKDALRALRRRNRSDTRPKIVVRRDKYTEEVLDPRPQVVAAFMPPLRAAVKRLVISLLALLDNSLEADVAPDAVAALVQEQQRQEPADTAVV